MIYVDESWSLQHEFSSSLYDHSAEQTKWTLIYVFATHVNRSENRKIDWFTASCKRVDTQKLSRAFAMCVCVTYISCSICAKMLLLFCVYEQRLCCVFAVYVIAMHVNRSDKAKNRSIYCITQTCRCAKAELCLCNVCVCVMYMNCSMCAKTLLSFCVYEQRLCHVFAVYVFATHVNQSENRKINRFTASHQCVCAQKLNCAFAVYVCMLYMSSTYE